MSNPALPALALLTLAPAAADQPRVAVAQMTIHQRIVIRIPRMIAPEPPRRPEQPRFVRKKGPKCVDMRALERAIINGSDSIDLMTEEGDRIRAKFEGGCPALDFYPDLYLKPTSDGKICAGRDAVRSRSGSVCPIATFSMIVPKP
ncbi:hypothetical protein [Sphingomonas immobilis]|uniref:Uncharacterized protein n=1 Tax=Sphingomonas immobilis TaxID=3063997 RepID=A0ABT8ZY65_9SPHN|nr:hypothetical protein [Sphingomonas sp. CA1-15]MDO7842518.1 hypothetical protein [Sphingomonas sp. CA1-15]